MTRGRTSADSEDAEPDPTDRPTSVAPADAQHAANIINGQRRRSLGNQSPATLYAAATVQ